MTDFDAMGAGEGMDRLVGERVMGWHRETDDATDGGAEYWMCDGIAIGASGCGPYAETAPLAICRGAMKAVTRAQ